MRVLKAEKGSLKHPAGPGCRVLLDWPQAELFRREHAIPRVRLPAAERPPAAYPRLVVSLTKPGGESSERRANVDVWDYPRAALIIQTAEDEVIPVGSEIDLLRYEI